MKPMKSWLRRGIDAKFSLVDSWNREEICDGCYCNLRASLMVGYK